jgi:hypothetical protein
MQDALSGQLNRRQEMLRAAGNFANIADYEHARSHGRALPPLPALFIVVDEYSELLSQHPAFAELFVAIWLPDLGATDKRLLRAALERFGGRADWKSRWHILAVPTATFMGSASCVFSLGDPKTRRECSVIRTTNPAHRCRANRRRRMCHRCA